MSDQNINTFAPVASDKNVIPNQESHDTSIGAEKLTTSHNGHGLLMASIGKMLVSDGAKNDPISTMKTSIEGEKLREEDTMTMTQYYSDNIDTNHVHDSSTGDDYDIDYSGDPALMDSTAVGNGVHNRHGNDNIDCDSARGASQSTCGGGDPNSGHNVDESRIGDYSSFVREHATWLEDSSEDMAFKTSTCTANNKNATTHDGKATLNNEDQEGFGEQLLDSSTTTKLTQEISSNLDEKLDNIRSLTKRLLQELIVYIESMNKVASEYDRIRELEIQESRRLDNVEPAVNGASANMILRTTGESGTLLAATPTVIQGKKQQHCGSPGNRHRRHSLGLSTEAIHPRRNRPLTPITNKRSGSIVDRNGKKSRGKKRVSFE